MKLSILKRISAVSCVVLLMMLNVSAVSSAMLKNTTSGVLGRQMLYVGGSGPGNFSSIQAAVDNASAGDTVFVYDDSAPYYENIAINVSIQLLGENRNTTSIEGGHHALSIYADEVTVSGFRISNVGDFWNCCGFYVISSGNKILDNTIVNNLRMMGVFLDGASYNTISGNVIEDNNYHGIRMEFCSHNVVTNNTIRNVRGYGVYLWESTDNRIIGNTIEQTFWNGLFLGDFCVNNTLYHNNLIENLENAYDGTGGNVWDDGGSGNFWSDYAGSDNDNDGIGDSPYQIPGNVSSDRYPLMEQYGGQTTDLRITIEGGLGLTVTILNNGSQEATDIPWTITITDGLVLVPLSRQYTGVVPSLLAAQTVVIKKFVFGLGFVEVKVSADEASASMRELLLLWIVTPRPV